MKILIAEDDAISRHHLESLLGKWGYDVIATPDGLEAWEAMQREDSPELAILDWMMPGLDGVEVCRKIREVLASRPIHIILLTARGEKNNIVTGLEAGADDYLTKPFDREELRARVRVGARAVELQKSLTARVEELQYALSQVKQLQGILPICSHCKKIRDDQNYWQQVDSYISSHSEALFSHSVCPDCYNTIVTPEMERLMRRGNVIQ